MKKLLFISALLFSNVFYSQFSKLNSKLGKSLIHNSIAKSKPSSNFYVVASTVKFGNKYDINLSKIDSSGNTVWEREINLKKDDRVLDVIVDNNDDILITGYTGTKSLKRLYVAKFSSAGNLINDFILNSSINTVGTKIIYSKKTRDYFIGGYTYNKSKPYDMVSKALLLSVNSSLTNLNWEAEYSLSQINNTITDIVELPNDNLFITGSLGQNKSGQIVLAAIVNPKKDGDVIPDGNLSFGVSQDYSLGASAVYDPSLDKIWLLFNAGYNGKPHYIAIDNATSAGVAQLAPYGFKIDINNTPTDKYAALKIMLSPSHSNGLSIFGYKDQTTLYSSGFGLWAMDINKFTAGIYGGLKVWDSSGPTLNLEHQGGDVLSLFSKSLGTGMPYFHTPSIAVNSHKGNKFIALTLDDVSGNTDLGLISFNNNLFWASSPCLNTLDPVRHIFHTNPKGIFKNLNNNSIVSLRMNPLAGNSFSQAYCSISSIAAEQKSSLDVDEKITEKTELTVYPNPTNDFVTVTNKGENSINEIRLINEIGQTVFKNSISSIKDKIVVDLSQYKKGIYILVTSWDNGNLSNERIVKL